MLTFQINNKNISFLPDDILRTVWHYMIMNYLIINFRLHYHQLIRISLIQKIKKKYWPLKLKSPTIILQPKSLIYLM